MNTFDEHTNLNDQKISFITLWRPERQYFLERMQTQIIGHVYSIV